MEENNLERSLDFEWELCGRSRNSELLTYKAELPDGTMYLTVSPLSGMAKVYVPDEVYVVDDTDYSKPPTEEVESPPLVKGEIENVEIKPGVKARKK